MNVTIPNTGGGQQQPTSITPTPNTTVLRNATGQAQVAVPVVAADIARLDTVTAHSSLTNNPHAVTAVQVGAVRITGDTVTGSIHAADVRWGNGHSRGINLPVGTDLNTIINAGWYDVSTTVNRPTTDVEWFRIMVTRGHSDIWVHQLVTTLHSNSMWQRRSVDDGSGVRAWMPWLEIWHSGNQSMLFTNPSFTGNVGINTAVPTAPLDIEGNTVRVRTARTPLSATDIGNVGDICWDANFVYVCTATNTWRRSALTAW